MTLNALQTPIEPGRNSSGNLLVVDDDPVSRYYFQVALERAGWNVSTAHNGVRAQSIYLRESGNFDCVLIDYFMPGINGIELIDWFRDGDPTIGYVLLTGDASQQLTETALARGITGFLRKPIQREDLIREVDRAVRQAKESRRLATMARAVERVGQTQKSILRLGAGHLSAGMQVSHYPRHEAGGDFLVRYLVNENETLILAADVSGHDLESAFVAAHFQGLVRGMLQKGAPPQEVLQFFNQILLEEWGNDRSCGDQFNVRASIAVVALLVNSQSKTVTVMTNGNPLPVLTEASGKSMLVGQQNCPLGWFGDLNVQASTYEWHRFSSVRLWTDGLEELAENLGVDPLAVVFALRASNVASVSPSWLSRSNDDVLAAKIPLSSEEPIHSVEPILFETHEKSTIADIDDWQARWERSLQFAIPWVSSDTLFDVILIAREALLNGLRHGCSSDSDVATLHIAHDPVRKKLRVIASDPGGGHAQLVGKARREIHKETYHRGLDLISQGEVTTHRNGAEIWIDLDVVREESVPSQEEQRVVNQ